MRRQAISDERTTRRFVYHGRVQGVGFRHTTWKVAGRHPVTGFVRNLPDGTVEVVAQGESSAIDAFVGDVSQAMRGYVERRDETDPPSGESFEAFEVRH